MGAFLLSVCIGAEKINFFKLFGAGTEGGEIQDFTRIIFFRLRLPRSLLVFITGILLGGAGAVFQLFFRNPLAEPGILGISSGATLGAVSAQVMGLGAMGLGFGGNFMLLSPVNLFAFCGAVVAGLIVVFIAGGKNNNSSSIMILLCGTALGTLYSAVSSILLLTSNKEMRSIYSWTLGSFNGRGWNELGFILIPAVAALLLMFILARPLDLLTCGEKSAQSLGLNVGRLRILVLSCGALAVSAAVCAGGTIGFVGLIAPHIVRKIAGSKGRLLIPFSMVFGAVILLLADTLARVVIQPAELPAGIITSILGVPFFISLVVAEKNRS